MRGSQNSWFASVAAALIGLLACLGLTVITGDDVAWDSNLYYIISIPAMTFMAYVFGFSFPEGPWRWVVCMAFGQFSSIIFVDSAMEFWWLTLGFLLLASVPQMIAAYVGSNVAWNRTRR